MIGLNRLALLFIYRDMDVPIDKVINGCANINKMIVFIVYSK